MNIMLSTSVISILRRHLEILMLAVRICVLETEVLRTELP